MRKIPGKRRLRYLDLRRSLATTASEMQDRRTEWYRSARRGVIGMGALSPVDGGGLLPPGVRQLKANDPAEIAGYALVGRLGSGGMGVVYLGRDPLGGLVAVKSAHGRLT